ncbi:MAG TPA: hypothetical protein VIG47_12220 [Gemmatimonadaceae bacterium]|jgi:hypothetical protein
MSAAMDLTCFGGPLDGLSFRTLPCTTVTFERARQTTGQIIRDVYALEVTDEGFFRLRYLNTQENPAR